MLPLSEEDIRRICLIRDRLARHGLVGLARDTAIKHRTTFEAMVSRTNRKSAVAARHEMFSLLRTEGLSTSEIGILFDRDHSSVVSATSKAKKPRAVAVTQIAAWLRRMGCEELAVGVETGRWRTDER